MSASVASGKALGAELFLAEPVAPGQPSLMGIESALALSKGDASPLDRSLVAQVTPRETLDFTRKALQAMPKSSSRPVVSTLPAVSTLDVAEQQLAEAYRNGVTLIMGTGSGNPLVIHGPALHRELQLWVQAGVPPAVALQTATYNGARVMHADNRIGLIREGYDAENLLLVDGNPLQDISATERISAVIFRGERLQRGDLFKHD